MKYTMELVSYPDPLPAAILFPPRIKWWTEVGLGTRLTMEYFLCGYDARTKFNDGIGILAYFIACYTYEM